MAVFAQNDKNFRRSLGDTQDLVRLRKQTTREIISVNRICNSEYYKEIEAAGF